MFAALPLCRDVKLQADLARVCDNSKVTDHHAILPTAEFLKTGFSSLADSETKLMTLVCAKLLCAVAAPYEYEAVTAVFTCGGYTFTAKGRTTLCEGGARLKDYPAPRPGNRTRTQSRKRFCRRLPRGRPLTIRQRRSPNVTRSPQRHLPKIRYFRLWRTRERKDTPEDAERKGLGTTATRAGIIEKLISAGFAERKGKKLIPTKDGYNLAAILPDSPYVPAAYGRMGNRALPGLPKAATARPTSCAGLRK